MSVKQISKILIKSGLSENLPNALSESEMAFATDTGEVFIGAPNLAKIDYRASTADSSGIYPYQNIKLMTEFDFPKAITSDYYTLGPLMRLMLPTSISYEEVYVFDNGLDTFVINYSLFDDTSQKTIFSGILRIAQDGVYGDMLQNVSFKTEYNDGTVTLYCQNQTSDILTMNMSGQSWTSTNTKTPAMNLVGSTSGGDSSTTTTNQIIEWILSNTFDSISNTVIKNSELSQMDVTYLDGATGVYTVDSYDTNFPDEIASYHVTYQSTLSSYTFTQSTITRDPTTGIITNRPSITF